MKTLIAAFLVCTACAAGAQSYERRAELEKMAADLRAIDDYNMEKARAALKAQNAPKVEPTTPKSSNEVPTWLIVGALGVAGYFAFKPRNK